MTRALAALCLACAAGLAWPASAAIVRWDLEGRVASLAAYDPYEAAFASSLGFTADAPVTGRLEFESDTAPYVGDPTSVYYGAVTRFSLDVGGLHLESTSGDFLVTSGGLSWLPFVYTILAQLPRDSLPGVTLYAISLQLLAAEGTAPASSALPLEPPPLASLIPFDLETYLYTQTTSGMEVSGSGLVVMIEPLRLTAAPEPGLALLVALALATQWLARASGAQSLRQGRASSSARDT